MTTPKSALPEQWAPGLQLHCSIACLLSDEGGLLARAPSADIRCDYLVASPAVNAQLLCQGARVRAGSVQITDYQGPVTQLPEGALPPGADFAGQYVLAAGDVLVPASAARAFEKAAGGVIAGTLYYPDSCPSSAFSQLSGGRCPYPADAFPLLAGGTLEQVLQQLPAGCRRAWVHGEVVALSPQALRQAQEDGVQITCRRLVTRQPLMQLCAPVFCAQQTLALPDGCHPVAGPVRLGEEVLALYGPDIFVSGALLLQEEDLPLLQRFSRIRVQGIAGMPCSCLQAFQAVGTADGYRLWEGRLYTVDGWELFTRQRLQAMALQAGHVTLQVDGAAIFDEDVTAQDLQCVARLDYDGLLVMPARALAALAPRMGTASGAALELEPLLQQTGLTLAQLLQRFAQGGLGGGLVRTGVFLLR